MQFGLVLLGKFEVKSLAEDLQPFSSLALVVFEHLELSLAEDYDTFRSQQSACDKILETKIALSFSLRGRKKVKRQYVAEIGADNVKARLVEERHQKEVLEIDLPRRVVVSKQGLSELVKMRLAGFKGQGAPKLRVFYDFDNDLELPVAQPGEATPAEGERQP